MKTDRQLLERRNFIRFNKAFGVNIIEVSGKKTLPKFDHEIGVNLSSAGALVKCERPIRNNSKIKLKIMLVRNGSYKTIETSAKAIWCEKSFDPKIVCYYIGLGFTRLSRSDKGKVTWFFK